jgi:hypothetical protein
MGCASSKEDQNVHNHNNNVEQTKKRSVVRPYPVTVDDDGYFGMWQDIVKSSLLNVNLPTTLIRHIIIPYLCIVYEDWIRQPIFQYNYRFRSAYSSIYFGKKATSNRCIQVYKLFRKETALNFWKYVLKRSEHLYNPKLYSINSVVIEHKASLNVLNALRSMIQQIEILFTNIIDETIQVWIHFYGSEVFPFMLNPFLSKHILTVEDISTHLKVLKKRDWPLEEFEIVISRKDAKVDINNPTQHSDLSTTISLCVHEWNQF